MSACELELFMAAQKWLNRIAQGTCAPFVLTPTATMSTVQDIQPGAVDSPSTRPHRRTLGDKLYATKQKVTTRHGWLGDYNYGWLCIPPNPFTKAYNQRSPPFYGLHDDLPLVLAAATGLQHALAMLACAAAPSDHFCDTYTL